MVSLLLSYSILVINVTTTIVIAIIISSLWHQPLTPYHHHVHCHLLPIFTITYVMCVFITNLIIIIIIVMVVTFLTIVITTSITNTNPLSIPKQQSWITIIIIINIIIIITIITMILIIICLLPLLSLTWSPLFSPLS